jgi:hypothetical protein
LIALTNETFSIQESLKIYFFNLFVNGNEIRNNYFFFNDAWKLVLYFNFSHSNDKIEIIFRIEKI